MRAEPGAACVHVIGAGLAGLAAAMWLNRAGRSVVLHEAARHAGGRCRSYFDAELGCRLDNGNHLLLTGNHAALDYLEEIGARGTLDGPPAAVFDFVDVASGQRWALRPNRGVVPWWIFARGRRVAGSRARDYLGALALRRADPSATVTAVLDPRQRLFGLLWEPLVVAALNTGAAQASASLFGTLLSQTLGRGGAACRPLVPRVGLSQTFVDPALVRLRSRGAQLRFGARLRALRFGDGRISELVFDGDSIRLGSADHVVLAVPAMVAARLVPGLVVPDLYSPIVNAHFRHSLPEGTPFFVGVVGGAVEWIFRKPEVLSVTVSAAGRFVDRPREELRELFWRDVAMAYGLARDAVPPAQIVKERRATFLASPEQLRRRPGPVTSWNNLLLAGDYVDTGLPATIEGAIRSGFTAARHLIDTFGFHSSIVESNDTLSSGAAAEQDQQQRAFHE